MLPGTAARYRGGEARVKGSIGWRTILVLAGVAILLLLLGVSDLSDQDRLTLENLLVLASFGGVGMALHRVVNGIRPWQRRVQAWAGRPMTHWNDWRIVWLLGGVAFGLHLLGSVELPPGDKWSSVSVLVLFALCVAAQMVNVAFFRKSGRK
jgi:hypothetical protein